MLCRIVLISFLASIVLLPHPSWAQPNDPSAQLRALTEELERLRQRIEELERSKTAQEAATRAIISQAISSSESRINNFVVLGGTFEQTAAIGKGFDGVSERVMALGTAELDFEVQVNYWTLGSLIFEYDDGTDVSFLTADGREASADRINIDTAFVTFGNTQEIVPFMSLGRMIVPFGISTGDPVADVLTLEDPLTVEAFETREDAVMFGVSFPTPAKKPLQEVVAPPPVRPRTLAPLFGKLSRAIGYRPAPTPPPTQTMMPAPPATAPFTAAVYFYNGSTPSPGIDRGWHPEDHFGAKIGYAKRGQNSFELDVNFNRSVFDSRLLEAEYRGFLDQIGLVTGLGASVKTNLGPVALIGEWNGALADARFRDDLDRAVSIRPRAWQLSLGYQFDWNSGVQAIGAQGTYIALGYSESRDLAGVVQLVDGEETLVGALPKRRFLVSAGEWILDGVRLAVEYSHIVDYKVREGGTGRSADAVVSMLTYEW